MGTRLGADRRSARAHARPLRRPVNSNRFPIHQTNPLSQRIRPSTPIGILMHILKQTLSIHTHIQTTLFLRDRFQICCDVISNCVHDALRYPTCFDTDPYHKAPPTSSTTSKQPSSPSSSMLTAAAPVVMSSPLSASSMPSDIQHLVAPVRSHLPATPLPLTTRSLSNPGPVRVQKNLVLSSASPPSPSSSSAPASMPRPVVRAVIPLSRNDGRTRNYAQVAATPTPTPTTTTKPHFTIRIITSIAPSPTFNIFPHHTFTVRIITPITPLPAVLPTSVCISSSSSSPSVSPPSSVSSPASPVLVQACALSWFMLSLLLSVGMSSSTSAAVGRNPLSVPVHA